MFYDSKQVINFFKKITLYVVRYNKDGCSNSAPCKNCMEVIKKLKIKKIVYSDDNGSFNIVKPENFYTNHISKINRKINNLRFKKN